MQSYDFTSLFHGATDAVAIIDDNDCIIDVNKQFIDIFNYEHDELKGNRLDDMIVDPDDKREALKLNMRVRCGELFTAEGIRNNRHGDEYHVFITGIPIIDGDIYKGAFVIYRDRTLEMKSKKLLINQKMTFESLFRNSNDAIVHIDVNKKVIDINEKFEMLFGYELGEIKGKEVDKLLVGEESLDESENLTNRLLSGEKIVEEGVRYGKHSIPKMYIVQGVPIISEGVVIGGYGIYTDITEKKEAENEVLYMSYHDKLTGLYNRRYFEDQLEKYNNYEIVSLILADMNGLKLVNDAFGHDAGDELLKRTAGLLKENCYETNIIARLGGDEFVILLPNMNEEIAERLVERCRVACNNEMYRSIEFSMSFGYGCKNSSCESLKVLFKRVEDQMYRNKLVEGPLVREKTFDCIIRSLHSKNEREEKHSFMVSEYCGKIAEVMTTNLTFVSEMRMAGWLHDIGKIAISDLILDKEDTLSEYEWCEIKKHPEIGYRILNSVNEYTKLSEAILYHHERYDGLGYPKGLKDEEIPIASRIISVADSYDAMISHRTYKKPLTKLQAVEELRKNSGSQFDPKIVEYFIAILEKYYI